MCISFFTVTWEVSNMPTCKEKAACNFHACMNPCTYSLHSKEIHEIDYYLVPKAKEVISRIWNLKIERSTCFSFVVYLIY